METLQRWHYLYVLNKSKLCVAHFCVNRMFFIWKGENVSEKQTLKHSFSKDKNEKMLNMSSLGVKSFTFLHLGKKKSLHQKFGHVQVIINLDRHWWKRLKWRKQLKHSTPTRHRPWCYVVFCFTNTEKHSTGTYIQRHSHPNAYLYMMHTDCNVICHRKSVHWGNCWLRWLT